MRWVLVLVMVAACGGKAASHDGLVADAGPPPSAMLAISPASKDFGAVLIACGSAPTTFTIRNTGGATTAPISDSIIGTDATAFAIAQDGCAGGNLAPGESCTIAVAVAPANNGPSSAALAVSASGVEVMAALGAVRNSTIPLGASPSTLSFLGVPLGSSATMSFTVTNEMWCPTTGPLAVSGLSGASTAMFSVANDTCAGLALAGGESCTVSVVFAPTAPGPQAASIDVGSIMGGQLDVGLLGSAPGLSIDPATLDLGQTPAGMTSSQHTISVFNGGPAPAALSVSASGDAAMFDLIDMCSGGSLAAGASCSLLVTFGPATPGTFDAQYAVGASSGDMVAVAVHAVGGPPADFTIAPKNLDLESCSLAPTAFTVMNIGPTAYGPLAATIAGTDPGNFAIGQDGCSGTMLAPDATCTIAVRYVPTGPPAGARSAALQLTAPGAQDVVASLSGSTPSGLGASTCRLVFEGVAPGSTATQTFTVTNEAALATGPIQVSLAGASGRQFPTSGCAGQTLALFESCTMTVTFAPTAVGSVSTYVDLIATPGGNASVEVWGN